LIYYSERHKQRVQSWRKSQTVRDLSIGAVVLFAAVSGLLGLYHESMNEGQLRYQSHCAPQQDIHGTFLHCPLN
jgi:hypothetical protein